MLSEVLLFGIALWFIQELNKEYAAVKERKAYCASRGINNIVRNPFYAAYFKRTFDILCALVVLIGIIPILCLVLGPLIRLSSPGPLFYKQIRIGIFGHPFYCYKFRTMFLNSGNKEAQYNDPRITAIGIVLRQTHLDEFPQFFNILRGEMSLVGPRPLLRQMTAENYEYRLEVKPGLTGWSQIYKARESSLEDKIAGDITYLKKLSFITDLKIIFRTMKFSDKSY